MTEKDEKKRALDLALAQIEKQYGKGAVMKLGADDRPADVPAISTTQRLQPLSPAPRWQEGGRSGWAQSDGI